MTVTESVHLVAPPAGPSLCEALARLDDAAAEPSDTLAVTAALDALLLALDCRDTAVLDEMLRCEPRLSHRIVTLHQTACTLAERAAGLRHTLDHPACDAARRRDQLAGLARTLRRIQSDESDIVFDALNTDLGAGD